MKVVLLVLPLLLGACFSKMERVSDIGGVLGNLKELPDGKSPLLEQVDEALVGFSRVKARGVKARYEYCSQGGYRAKVVTTGVAGKTNEKAIDRVINNSGKMGGRGDIGKVSERVKSCAIVSPEGDVVFLKQW